MAPAFLVALLIQIAPLVTEERLEFNYVGRWINSDALTKVVPSSPSHPMASGLNVVERNGPFHALGSFHGETSSNKERVKIEQLSRNEPVEDLSPQLFLGNDHCCATYPRKKAGEWDIGSAVLSVPDFKVEARFPGRFISRSLRMAAPL